MGNQTLTAKAGFLIIKWILKQDNALDMYGLNLWLKAWRIGYQAKHPRATLKGRMVRKKKLAGLGEKWEGLNVSPDSLDAVISEAEVVILHHVMKILSEARNLKDDNLQQAMLETLQKIYLKDYAVIPMEFFTEVYVI